MNLEHERIIKDEREKRSILINEVPKKCFGEYFENLKLGKELNEKSIPRLMALMDLSLEENSEVIFGGSGMEILSGLMTEKEYWHLKEEMSMVKDEIGNIEPGGNRSETLIMAIDKLSGGDPDFDFYLQKRQDLKNFFNKIKKISGGDSEVTKTESGGEIFKILISENVYLETYWGPVNKGSFFDRVQLQLKDMENKALFHIDLTALTENGVDAAQNRRQNIGDVHDKCRGKYVRYQNSSRIEYVPNLMPKAEEATEMNLDKRGKDPKTFLEIVLRELRKKTMHFDSVNNLKREFFSISRIYPLLSIEDIFTLRELFSKDLNSGSEIYENQSEDQKKIIYQEFLLSAQKDPFLALEMLQDTGMDALFFGRHLSRKEVLAILSSEYLNFGPQNMEIPRKERIKKSREKYIQLADEGEKRKGLICLIKAVGQVLGKETDKNNYKIHLQKGLAILIDPEKEVVKLRVLKLSEIKNSNKDAIKQLSISGGLTETELHCLINKKDPIKYPNNNVEDKKNFHKNIILPLIKSNLIEVANREIKIGKRIIKTRFYYPCIGSTRIEEILYQAGKGTFESKIAKAYSQIGIESMEAIVGISPKDLREEGKNLMAFFMPIFLKYLINLQREIEKSPKTHKYTDKNRN